MQRKVYVFLLLLLITAFAPVSATGAAVQSPAESLGAYHHTALRQQDGAPSDIGDIAQDKDGFLWVIGSRGVTRFDGRTFVQSAPSGDSFSEAQIHHMVAAPDGGLWLSYVHNPPSYLFKGRLTNGLTSGLDGRARPFVDAMGNVWAVSSHGLLRLKGRQWVEVPTSEGKAGCGFGSSDEVGNIWYDCDDKVFFVAKGTMTPVRVDGVVSGIIKVYAGRNGIIIAATQDSIHFYRVTGARVTPVMAPLKLFANRIYQDRDGAVWITSSSIGVSYISAQAFAAAERTHSAPELESMTKADGLSGSFEAVIFQDRDGTIWIGSESGLDRFTRSAFTAVRLPYNLHEVTAAADDDGSLWVGSETMSLLHGTAAGPWKTSLDSSKFALGIYRDPYSSKIIVSIASGVYQVNQGSVTKVADQPRSALTGTTGLLCFAMNHAGEVVACNAENRGPSIWREKAWRPIGLPRSDVSAIAVDDADRIWMGRGADGQVVLWDKGNLQSFDGPNPRIGRIKAMFPDGSGVWIGGEHGIRLFDGTRFHTLQFAQPEQMEPVTGVVRDAEGNLWVQSLDGVFRVGNADIRAALGTPGLQLHPQAFGLPDGIVAPPDPDIGLPSLRFDGRGRIWAQSVSGLAWIDPAKPLAPARSPAIYIESVQSGGSVLLPTDGSVELKGKQAEIRINFASPVLARPDLVRFSYRLVGLESDWRDAGTSYRADYNSLPPGHYRFEVRMVATDGRTVLSAASISIYRHPGPFETWWFKSLALLPIAILIWLLFKLRMQVMIRNERIRSDEREAVARDIHDTLLQRFQGVIMTVQAWSLDERIPSKQRAEALRISSQARDAMLEGRERVLKLRNGEDPGLLLYDRLLREAEQLRDRYTLQFTIQVMGSPRALTVACEHELGDAAIEGMRNAFAHSGGTAVTVTINYTPRALWLLVADDGNGMPKDLEMSPGERPRFGLVGMRERVSRLGGEITTESSPDEGTILHMRVPARQAYANRKKRSAVSS